MNTAFGQQQPATPKRRPYRDDLTSEALLRAPRSRMRTKSLSPNRGADEARSSRHDRSRRGRSCGGAPERDVRAEESDGLSAQGRDLEDHGSMQCTFHGAIVTFDAGAGVSFLIPGSQTRAIRLRSQELQLGANEVQNQLRSQGLAPSRFYISSFRKTLDDTVECDLLVDSRVWKVLFSGLDGPKLNQKLAGWEEGLHDLHSEQYAIAESRPDVLTVSWDMRVSRYIVEYHSAAEAANKIAELDGQVLEGHRIAVFRYTGPMDYFSPPLGSHVVEIQGLPQHVDDSAVQAFAESRRIYSLPMTDDNDHLLLHTLLLNIFRITKGGAVLDFWTGLTASGTFSLSVRFRSRQDAKTAHRLVREAPYDHPAPILFSLPDKLSYSFRIPKAQYLAQKGQWAHVFATAVKHATCKLTITIDDQSALLEIVGSDSSAFGALKVRVQALAAGEIVNAWTEWCSHPDKTWLNLVGERASVFIAEDAKQTLRLYGQRGFRRIARTEIDRKLAYLSSERKTVVATAVDRARSSFLHQGFAQLEELDNLQVEWLPKTISVTGDDKVLRSVRFLWEESRDGRHSPASEQRPHTCTICCGDAVTPLQLACGHIYCLACFRNFVISAAASDNFPLLCLGTESQLCNTPIALITLQRVFSNSELKSVLGSAFASHIHHSQDFEFCRTDDCLQIHRVTPSTPQVVECPSCLAVTCSACQGEGHGSISCEVARVAAGLGEKKLDYRTDAERIALLDQREKKVAQIEAALESYKLDTRAWYVRRETQARRDEQEVLKGQVAHAQELDLERRQLDADRETQEHTQEDLDRREEQVSEREAHIQESWDRLAAERGRLTAEQEQEKRRRDAFSVCRTIEHLHMLRSRTTLADNKDKFRNHVSRAKELYLEWVRAAHRQHVQHDRQGELLSRWEAGLAETRRSLDAQQRSHLERQGEVDRLEEDLLKWQQELAQHSSRVQEREAAAEQRYEEASAWSEELLCQQRTADLQKEHLDRREEDLRRQHEVPAEQVEHEQLYQQKLWRLPSEHDAGSQSGLRRRLQLEDATPTQNIPTVEPLPPVVLQSAECHQAARRRAQPPKAIWNWALTLFAMFVLCIGIVFKIPWRATEQFHHAVDGPSGLSGPTKTSAREAALMVQTQIQPETGEEHVDDTISDSLTKHACIGEGTVPGDHQTITTNPEAPDMVKELFEKGGKCIPFHGGNSCEFEFANGGGARRAGYAQT